MLKYYLTIILSFLLVPTFVFSANTDVTMSGSTVITVGGINLTVSGAATFDQIVVNSGNFVLSATKGAAITVTSSDRRSFTVSPVQYQQSFSCESTKSTLIVGNNIWDTSVNITVTPSSSACGIDSGGSPGGGGPSGGGGAPTASYTVIPGTADTTATTDITPTTPVSTTPTVVSVSSTFTTVMKVGSEGEDVKRLQQLLNSDPDTMIASLGVGSLGNETNYYGSLTREAVKKFQIKHGIVSSGNEETTGFGLVGPGTRAKLAEVFAIAQPTAPEVAQPSPVAVSVSPVFSSGMAKGESNTNIKRLQQLLNSDPDTTIASSGVGSSGNETNYFGSLTEKAVQKFQMKYGVVSSASDAGYGYVGPKTRAKIAEVFGSASVTPTTPATPATPATPSAPASSPAQAELETQLQLLLQQLENMQAELNTM